LSSSPSAGSVGGALYPIHARAGEEQAWDLRLQMNLAEADPVKMKISEIDRKTLQ
jgi:hypothetical protein